MENFYAARGRADVLDGGFPPQRLTEHVEMNVLPPAEPSNGLGTDSEGAALLENVSALAESSGDSTPAVVEDLNR